MINSIVTLSGILLTYYFTKRRYSYEKLFDKKLVSLEEIYSKVISLEKDMKKYIFTIGADMKPESLSQKKKEIILIQDKFFELRDYFWKKEIILNQNSIVAIQSFIDISSQILGNLMASIISQQLNDYNVANKQWHDSYQLIEDVKKGLLNTKEKLKNDFKGTIKNS